MKNLPKLQKECSGIVDKDVNCYKLSEGYFVTWTKKILKNVYNFSPQK